MLGPHDRRLLLDALRPPDGYALDFAVGTTYSLDLVALLTAPLAFTMFDWQDADGRPSADPLATLESLRRYADRIAVFCQAGQTLVPKQHRVLFGYLEGSVFEVASPGAQTSFHPKAWALRFTTPDGAVCYRLLCLSRNLTFDRSWDTALVLEGELGDRKNGIAGNHPLGDFFAALPGMSKRPLPPDALTRVERFAAELRRVPFAPPDGFDEIRYWPLGIAGRKSWPFEDWYSRVLVVSPFLSAPLLERVTGLADDAVLVSRLDSLQEFAPEALSNFSAVHAMNPSADVEESQTGAEEEEPEPSTGALPTSGLHAKLYIAERGWDASVFTGSANATSAAFGGNVEFVVELVGKKSRVGIDAFLKKTDGGLSFADLLQPFNPGTEAVVPDAGQKHVDELAEAVQRQVSRLTLTAHVSKADGDLFDVTLDADGGTLDPVLPNVELHCWPITLSEHTAAAVSPGPPLATFRGLSFAGLTSFFAFRVTARAAGKVACLRFVLNVPLVGAPSDRRERILKSLLSTPEQVLRFLMFLLSEFGAVGGGPESAGDAFETGGGPFHWGAGGTPLFESLVRALDQSPARLDQVAKLVEDLRAAGENLLPAGFDEVWLPVWEARQKVSP